ncbi:MAG: thiamine pyrophosphate-dependent enzyme [Candidatus Eisenbacteria bacterium]|jgi:indolepyruvate ferredoxin oxidoreductase alpha subunit|nr:thiamine pyrophosphate-dependent enzyme [Candidatus Eisenbacteria bacterium]
MATRLQIPPAGTRLLLTGNQACALAAATFGCNLGVGYPGTPSSEILDALVMIAGSHTTQWETNEKTAVEKALGASMAGGRVIVTMKHVGVNVAADPLLSFASTFNSGLVLVVGDDPGAHSSQNEQDTRMFMGLFANLPILAPSDSQEVYDFVGAAFEISDRFRTPVVLRLTTNICHAETPVVTAEPMVHRPAGYVNNFPNNVVLPANFRKLRHRSLHERLPALTEYAETATLTREDAGTRPEFGIITEGVSYAHVKEVVGEAIPILKLGMVFPLPLGRIARFVADHPKTVVCEELEPYVELQTKAEGIPILGGKAFFPREGEFTAGVVAQGLAAAGLPVKEPTAAAAPVPGVPRPPTLCPGCPHRATFYVLNRMKANVFGDIGCYTLGGLEPLSALHACICMGASIGMAAGVATVARPETPVVAILGDSTFLHSGITPLLGARWNGADFTVVILDNGITAMTGGQPNPGVESTLEGASTPKTDIEALVRALGVEHIAVVDGYDVARIKEALTAAVAHPGVAVVISRRPCALMPTKRHYKVLRVDHGKCIGCHTCVKVGCPAISLSDELTDKGRRKSYIDPRACIGCTVCQQVCPVGAIVDLEAV